MNVLSPFTPIFFPEHQSDGLESRYVQTFAATDRILIQYFGDAAVTQLLDGDTEAVLFTLTPQSWEIGDTTLHFIELRGLTAGLYKLRHDGAVSYPFRVTANEQLLAGTILLQYSMRDNRRRHDAVFMVDGMRKFFDFRVPGGFKDSEVAFAVDSEDYDNADGDPNNLYALESMQQMFTLGHQEGVPMRFAELLNRLLTCTYVYVDGIRYCRREGSVPEVNTLIEGLDSFVFKVNLQRVRYSSPTIEAYNQMQIRRADDTSYRAVNDTNRII